MTAPIEIKTTIILIVSMILRYATDLNPLQTLSKHLGSLFALGQAASPNADLSLSV